MIVGGGLGGMVVDGVGFSVQKVTGKAPGSADPYESIDDISDKTELLE